LAKYSVMNCSETWRWRSKCSFI